MSNSISYRDLTTLKTWKRNYRHGDVGAIITSIVTFGFNHALRVWNDNTVIAGNHSLLALQSIKAQGLQPPRGIRADKDNWIIPCIDVSHLTETQAQAFAIADNRTSELAENDNQQLADLLSEIAAQDEKLLAATGYDGDDVDALLKGLSNPTNEDWNNILGNLATGDRAPFQQMTFTLHDDQVIIVKQAMDIAKAQSDFVSTVNENSNGNSLSHICEIYIMMFAHER